MIYMMIYSQNTAGPRFNRPRMIKSLLYSDLFAKHRKTSQEHDLIASG